LQKRNKNKNKREISKYIQIKQTILIWVHHSSGVVWVKIPKTRDRSCSAELKPDSHWKRKALAYTFVWCALPQPVTIIIIIFIIIIISVVTNNTEN